MNNRLTRSQCNMWFLSVAMNDVADLAPFWFKLSPMLHCFGGILRAFLAFLFFAQFLCKTLSKNSRQSPNIACSACLSHN